MTNTNKLILFLAVFNLTSEYAHSSSHLVNGLYGAFGDSITAGAIAMTPSPRSLPGGELRTEATTRKLDIAQDIIYPFVESRYENSWATGKKINSYYKKLQLLGKYQIPQISWKAINVARTNKGFADLNFQFENFKKSFLKEKPQTVHATLLLGANDLCPSKDPLGQFDTTVIEERYREFLTKLDNLTEGVPTEVVVVNLLRIPDLGESRFAKAKIFIGLTCAEVRSKINTCKHMITWKTDFEKILAQTDVDRLNDVLNQAPLQPFKNITVKMADGIQNNRFETSDLATDCFHPGKLGQQHIADKVWTSIVR